MLLCKVVGTKRVDAVCRASGGAEQVVADVRNSAHGRRLEGFIHSAVHFQPYS